MKKSKSHSQFKVKPLSSFTKHIDLLKLWYDKVSKRTPVKDWSSQEREALILNLHPLMEIYNNLVDLQEQG